MISWNEIDVVRNARFSAPPATCVLPVSMTHKNGGRRNFFSLLYKGLPQQGLSCTTVVYKKDATRSSVRVCTFFTAYNTELSGPLYISSNEIVTPLLRLCARPCQQHFFASFGMIARQNTVFFKLGTAASQPSQRFILARVRADHSQHSSLSRCTINNSRVE